MNGNFSGCILTCFLTWGISLSVSLLPVCRTGIILLIHAFVLANKCKHQDSQFCQNALIKPHFSIHSVGGALPAQGFFFPGARVISEPLFCQQSHIHTQHFVSITPAAQDLFTPLANITMTACLYNVGTSR